MSALKQDHITEESIKQLIDTFYAKVRADKSLGPIFEEKIGTDRASWKKHLHTMYDFWSSIMLGSGRYHGNPHQAHRELPSFEISLFERWLSLFEQTAHEVHAPTLAQKYVDRSQRIAESLKLSIQTER